MNHLVSSSAMMSSPFTRRWREMIWGRVLFVATFLSFLTVLLFALAVLMTDGETPRNAGEWLITVLCNLLAWPVVITGWLSRGECPEVFLWLAWFLGGLFWAVLMELFIFTRRKRN